MRSISSVSIYISYSAGSNKNLIGMPIIPLSLKSGIISDCMHEFLW